MTGYSMPFMGSVIRTVYYNGKRWIHVIQRGGFWSDDMRTQHWTNVQQGPRGIPRLYDKGGIWKGWPR